VSEPLVTFPLARRLAPAWTRFFAESVRLAAPANANEARRAVLFDMSACFGAMPVCMGPVAIVRAQQALIAATGEGWYADMPRDVRAMLLLNRAALEIVEIPVPAGEWPELDAILEDLFQRSGLPPDEAIRRRERLLACLRGIGAHLGPVPGVP